MQEINTIEQLTQHHLEMTRLKEKLHIETIPNIFKETAFNFHKFEK